MLVGVLKTGQGNGGPQASVFCDFRVVITLTVLLLLSSLAKAQARKNSTESLNFILQSMERAEKDIQLPLRVTRQYRLTSGAKSSTHSEVVAEVDFSAPGKYIIQSRSGNGRAEEVVKNILQREIEVAGSVQKMQAAAMNRQNYSFAYLGKVDLNGTECYLLQITPKRAQSQLVFGRTWVSTKSFLVMKVEGTLAKSPSWWIRSVHVDLDFTNSPEGWIQTNMKAVADVRFFGEHELSSHVLSYDGPRLAAHSVRHSITLLPATAVH